MLVWRYDDREDRKTYFHAVVVFHVASRQTLRRNQLSVSGHFLRDSGGGLGDSRGDRGIGRGGARKTCHEESEEGHEEKEELHDEGSRCWRSCCERIGDVVRELETL
jgi:hypothetical protein